MFSLGRSKDSVVLDLTCGTGKATLATCAITGHAHRRMSAVDIATGATAHAPILEALIQHDRTGKEHAFRCRWPKLRQTVPLLKHNSGKTSKRVGLVQPWPRVILAEDNVMTRPTE